MNDRVRLTERLPGLGWVVALAGLLLLAVFSALWVPGLPGDAGVLDKGSHGLGSSSKGRAGNDSPVPPGRDKATGAGPASEASRPEEPAPEVTASPIAAKSERSGRRQEGGSRSSGSSGGPEAGRGSQRQVDGRRPAASHSSPAAVRPKLASQNGTPGRTKEAAAATSRGTDETNHRTGKAQHPKGRNGKAHHRKDKGRKDKAHHRNDKGRKDKAHHRNDKGRKDKGRKGQHREVRCAKKGHNKEGDRRIGRHGGKRCCHANKGQERSDRNDDNHGDDEDPGDSHGDSEGDGEGSSEGDGEHD